MGFQKFRQPILAPYFVMTGGVALLNGAGAPTDGTTGKNLAGPGSAYFDKTNAIVYLNTGTKASPTWRSIGGGAGISKQVYNGTGSTITAGSIVYESGWNDTLKLPAIALADADAGGKPGEYVAVADIANLAQGLVTTALRSAATQNTNGATVGDAVYLNTTAGGWTLTPPTAANALQQIVGRVAVVSATVGVVAFDIVAPFSKIGSNEIENDAVQAAALGVTAGGVTASRALVVDTNKDITGLRNFGTTGNTYRSVAVPAAAGANQGNGTALTADLNAVTGADGTKGVVLPTAIAGMAIEVINTDPTSLLKVYPATGGAINSLGANAAYALSPGEAVTFRASSTTQWYVSIRGSLFTIGGVAAGYKVARGQLSTASAADTVVTGLATVVAAVAVLESDPADVCSVATCQIGNQAGAPVAGSIIIKTWKPTVGGAAGNPTLIAATTFSKLVNWIAVGT